MSNSTIICPKCRLEQPPGGAACPRCGLIFRKYQARHNPAPRTARPPAPPGQLPGQAPAQGSPPKNLFKELFLHVEPDINVIYFAGRVLLFLAVFVWSWKFILSPIEANYAGRSFMHLVNLPFHEAGHMLFRPFGQFMMMCGGSLMQLLVPLVCLLTFLLKTRDTFAASLTLWWLGESLMDLAPYINDARSLRLILLGGVTGREVSDYHDWEFILRKLGMLRYDHFLAHTANSIGIAFMIVTFAWGGYVLYRQYRNLDL
jgi:hypothetical protein